MERPSLPRAGNTPGAGKPGTKGRRFEAAPGNETHNNRDWADCKVMCRARVFKRPRRSVQLRRACVSVIEVRAMDR